MIVTLLLVDYQDFGRKYRVISLKGFIFLISQSSCWAQEQCTQVPLPFSSHLKPTVYFRACGAREWDAREWDDYTEDERMSKECFWFFEMLNTLHSTIEILSVAWAVMDFNLIDTLVGKACCCGRTFRRLARTVPNGYVPCFVEQAFRFSSLK